LGEVTPLAPVLAAARRYPDGAALIRPDGSMVNWRELASMAVASAEALGGAGIGAGDTVAFSVQPSEKAVVLLHGLWVAGAVPVPLNAALSDGERREALASLTPDWWWEDGAAGRVESPAPDPRWSGAAAILLTSGTTGTPRGVCVSHDNLDAVNRAAAQRLGLTETDVWSLYLSPAHVGGLAMIHRAALTGAALHLPGRFRPEGLVQDAAQARCTHASLVPNMLVRLVEYLESTGDTVPSGLACLLVGGAGTPPDLLDRALTLELPIALTYGLTQASSQVATAPPDRVRTEPGSVGPPLEGVELRIVDSQIQLRGPTVATGYVGDPATFLTADGWLATGDLGRTDSHGNLWITGRVGRRIISGGVNVEPDAVETFLRSIPGVRDAAVVGLPDPEWGATVAALLVGDSGSARGDMSDLVEACRAGLQPAARPRRVRWTEALPLNSNGKVDLNAVERLLGALEDSPEG